MHEEFDRITKEDRVVRVIACAGLVFLVALYLWAMVS